MDTSIKGLLSNFGINFGNVNEYPILSNKYFVIIGTNIFSFAKISGINLYSANVRAVNYGGTEIPYLVKEPNDTLNTIRFEKGFGTVNIAALVNKINMMILIIKGDDDSIQGVYYSDRMMVKNVTLSDLDASKSEVLIQTLEVAYNSFVVSSALDTAVSIFGKLFSTPKTVSSASSSYEDLSKDIVSRSKKNSDVTKKQTIDALSDDSQKSSYERERENIASDTERLKKLKEEGIKNSEIKRASEQNKAVTKEIEKEQENQKIQEEQEFQEKLSKIEL